jgi:hypothetical protein
MKHPELLLIFSLGILMSCSKAKEEQEPTSMFEVLEYKTGSPLAAVQLDFLHCTRSDLLYGCLEIGSFSTGFTDNSGRYSVKASIMRKSTQGIRLSKLNYWDSDGQPGTNYLAPEGWINIHLIRQNVYPFPRLFFGYNIESAAGKKGVNPLSVPWDTIIKVRAFGNEVNMVNWQIGSGIGPWYPGDKISYVDPVLARGILTQSPDRFGTTSVTLSY